MRYKILPVVVMLIGLLIAACTPDANDSEPVASDMQDSAVQMVVIANAQPSSEDGSTAGQLELDITFENPSEEEVTLDLTSTDYVLTTVDGIELTPSTLSDELQGVTIPANGSVSGEADFSVLSPIATFTFTVPGFEPVTIDASANEDFESESDGESRG